MRRLAGLRRGVEGEGTHRGDAGLNDGLMSESSPLSDRCVDPRFMFRRSQPSNGRDKTEELTFVGSRTGITPSVCQGSRLGELTSSSFVFRRPSVS